MPENKLDQVRAEAEVLPSLSITKVRGCTLANGDLGLMSVIIVHLQLLLMNKEGRHKENAMPIKKNT